MNKTLSRELFNILRKDDRLCVKIIKQRLPLRVKLFNKIKKVGIKVTDNLNITLYFTFNNSNNQFSCHIPYDEVIKSKIIKLNK